ncbi:hypothetical protein KXX57_005160 [Aspergillus fumigatus]|nr:hypothetical protein KXX57_005160 [Aspergillus fumigatus]KAH2669425.1 hypothetical protein KXV32_004172 [Aspergillus fumigatus]KAH2908532.1 hypothetical protein KXW25_004733 [Aspergillus fumigatus]
MSRPEASPGPTCDARGAQPYGCFSASGSLPSVMSGLERQFATLLTIVQNYQINVVCPKCLRGFSRARTLSDHFQKEDDWIHRGLDQRKTDFKRFLTCYQLAIGASIPAQELPRGSKCFDWRYVLEHYRAESRQPDELQTLPDEDNELETEEYHPPSEHADSWGPFSGHPVIIAPVYSDKEPRGLQCTGHEVQIESCKVLELDDQPRHLQVLKNEQVEARIRALIPQMESWLIGTLPIRDAFNNPQEDQGVVFPTTEIDVPLIAVRNLLYEGMLQKVRRRQSPCRQIVQRTIKTPSNERQHKKLVLIKDIQYTVGVALDYFVLIQSHDVAFGQPVRQKIRIYAQE